MISEQTTVNTNEEDLATYLNAFLHDVEGSKFPRKKCCGTSRSLYCVECSKLLIDRERWPASIQAGHLDLPFSLDIVLHDRRLSATGFHALVLLKASQGSNEDDDSSKSSHDVTEEESQVITQQERVRLFDIENGDQLPSYEGEDNNTFLLFPSENSVPISSVADQIHRLIVLDCKWTKSSCQSLPQLARIQNVHIGNPPLESYFWRWHNAGTGMCSTLEALYFAALETAEASNENRHRKDFNEVNRKSLIDLMWLFGIQRNATALSAKREGKPSPFSKDGKAMQRNLRKTEKGSEKHLRDIERGKRLMEEAKDSAS
jgi:hypothetical protein